MLSSCNVWKRLSHLLNPSTSLLPHCHCLGLSQDSCGGLLSHHLPAFPRATSHEPRARLQQPGLAPPLQSLQRQPAPPGQSVSLGTAGLLFPACLTDRHSREQTLRQPCQTRTCYPLPQRPAAVQSSPVQSACSPAAERAVSRGRSAWGKHLWHLDSWCLGALSQPPFVSGCGEFDGHPHLCLICGVLFK